MSFDIRYLIFCQFIGI